MPNFLEWLFLVSLIVLLIMPRKKKLLWITIFAFVVMVNIGIRVFFIYQSHQLKEQIGTLKGELNENKKKVSSLEGDLKANEEKVGFLQSDIDELHIQREDYQQQVDTLQAELEETKKLAGPNTIELSSKSFKRTKEGYSIKMRFKTTKNEPLGTILFVASLRLNSTEKIINFWPDGTFLSGAKSKMIEDSGLLAKLQYSLMAAGGPRVTLTVTGPTSIQIQGNFLSNPIVIDSSEFQAATASQSKAR